MPFDPVSAGFAAVGFITNLVSSNKEEKERQEAMEAQYQYNLENWGIDVAYTHQLELYANMQQAYAQQANKISWSNYGLAQADRANEIAYRERENKLMKQAAIVQYNADVQTAKINIYGARDQASAVINDALRVAGANTRSLGVKGDVGIGKVVNRQATGIVSGASKDALIADAYRKRAEAMNQLTDETKGAIIKTLAAFNKVQTDNTLKVGQSRRNLEATLLIEPRPVPHIPTPIPIFEGVQPVRPAPPAPIKGTSYTPNGMQQLTSAVNGAASAVNAWNALKPIFN